MTKQILVSDAQMKQVMKKINEGKIIQNAWFDTKGGSSILHAIDPGIQAYFVCRDMGWPDWLAKPIDELFDNSTCQKHIDEFPIGIIKAMNTPTDYDIVEQKMLKFLIKESKFSNLAMLTAMKTKIDENTYAEIRDYIENLKILDEDSENSSSLLKGFRKASFDSYMEWENRSSMEEKKKHLFYKCVSIVELSLMVSFKLDFFKDQSNEFCNEVGQKLIEIINES